MSNYLVFVYGSLKRNFGNHRFLVDSEFLGEFVTSDCKYLMQSFGPFPGVAFISSFNEEITKISGELYRVNQKTLDDLDDLEGNGFLYTRKLVSLENHDELVWMYLVGENSRHFSYIAKALRKPSSLFTKQIEISYNEKNEPIANWLG